MPHSILDLITERQTVVAAAIATLREQIGRLTDELRTAETELNDLATTRTTLTRLTSTTGPAIPDDGPLDNTVYQQILHVFKTGDSTPIRAKDVCNAPRYRHRTQRHRRRPRQTETPGQTPDPDRNRTRTVRPRRLRRGSRTARDQQS